MREEQIRRWQSIKGSIDKMLDAKRAKAPAPRLKFFEHASIWEDKDEEEVFCVLHL